jgi:hypothetical protein
MNASEYDYRQFIIDDCDSDYGDDGDYGDDECNRVLDTRWITEFETKNMNDEYQLFLKTDITRVSFEFFYLDRDKKCVERIVRMTYSLREINRITQNELFSVVQSHQKLDKKYYNFQSLLLYHFDFKYNDIVRALSEYIQNATAATAATAATDINHEKAFIEYTNLLSIDVIYFTPLISMFHDLIGFSVLLYED